MRVAKALLIIACITVILVVMSVIAYPEWLTIPRGLLLLVGIGLSVVLAAGGKIKDWIELLEKPGAIGSTLKDASLTITPQSKLIDGSHYIIINIVNNENSPVSCRVDVVEVYDEENANIKRQISQYANLFSWSGGSQNGTKEILPGLDGTANLAVRRTYAHGFYFLFHENPDTNWQKAGIYKLEVAIRGTIGKAEIVGKKVVIAFQYIKDEGNDGAGGFYNNSELKLLEWSIDKAAT